MLSKTGLKLFSQLNIRIQSENDLLSGVKLAEAVNKIFYDNQNDSFSSKIIRQNLQRKGNHIINANNILKQIKNDQNIQCPQQIRGMTSFTIIQNDGQLNKFVQWLNKQYEARVVVKHIIYQQSQPNQQDKYTNSHIQVHHIENNSQNLYQMASQVQKQKNDGFENVFFCHKDLSPGIDTPPLQDSLDSPDKVVKKGSFKIIRPKQKFDKNEQKNFAEVIEPNKQHIYINQMNDSQEKEPSARKTVPISAERPPLYRKPNKQTTQVRQKKQYNQKNLYKSPAPFNTNNFCEEQAQFKFKEEVSVPSSYYKMKNNSLNEDLRSLSKQIQKQNKQKSLNNSRKNSRSQSATQRKLFKIDIPEINDEQKKSVVLWLIDINLLNSVAASYYDRLHQICKNGVIFPQIINHEKGRGAQLCYFKKPKRSAQVHSNYQKVFSYLKDIPAFESELLFMYEYFVPQAQTNAFWNLLLSCKNCFQKSYSRVAKKDQQIYTRKNSLQNKMSRSQVSTRKNSSSKKRVHETAKKQSASKELEYQKIKYGSSQNFKKVNSEQKNSSRKSSLQFIQQIPERKKTLKDELIQKQQPIQLTNRAQFGYRQLHEFKKTQNSLQNSNIKTPQKKNISLNNQLSMSRSRVQSNSIKKIIKMDNPETPTVTLQMEMKSIKFLQQKGYLNQNDQMDQKTLFQDPVRNGSLLNLIIKNQFNQTNHRYVLRPKNITDCRHNFEQAFSGIKSIMVHIPKSFQHYYEQIIRGQISIFYGIIWHLIYSNKMSNGALRGESIILPRQNSFVQNQTNIEDKLIVWVQNLEQHSQQIARYQIRDIMALYSAVINSNLLFKIAEIILPEKYTIKPTYERPINHIEQESNLKKILAFFTHNRVLKPDYTWKARSIIKRDKIVLNHLLIDLMKFYMNKHSSEKAKSLAKYVKIQRSQSKPIQRLQTTINNSYMNQAPKFQQNVQKRNQIVQDKGKQDKNLVIQVQWMRKLGYTGDLSLNNGIILCRLLSRLTMKSITCNQHPQSKAQCLTNIRKAIRLIDKFKWDEHDICSADEKLTNQVYKFIKDKYKHSYAMKCLE